MEIRRLGQLDMEQARDVWHICFGDSYAFIDTYFQYAAKIENGWGIFEDGKLLSDLFFSGFNARIAGQDIRVPFIAGCATLPEARKKDYMRTLIRHTMTHLRESGMPAVYLHPFLHAFYRKFGFSTVAYVTNHRQDTDRTKIKNQVKIASFIGEAPVARMLQSYCTYMEQYDNCFERNGQRMDAWLRLLFADGGKAAYIPGERNIPYALFYENGDTADIFEMICFNAEQKDSLVNATGRHTSKFLLPAIPNGRDADEFTMMRVLDPEAMLQQYPFANIPRFVIHIEDDFLKKDYRYSVEKKRNDLCVERTDGHADIYTDIEGFSKMVSGVFEPSEASMVQDCFPLRNACYFETY